MTGEVEGLFRRQLRRWPLLAKGVEGLSRAQTRRMRIDWFEVFVRHIPHRVGSTTARVDPESVAKRPCFLCPTNLPPEEEGLRFGDDYIVYCNPFPIVSRHLTIAHREHCPQRIAGGVGTMLDLASALPGYFVIYNGPECGASAPDHLHFQAGLREVFPIEKDATAITALSVANYARNVLLFRRSDRSALIDRIDRASDLIAEATGKGPEPMVNIAVFREQQAWTACLFPRGKHRPAAYYSGELTVSPASIDLCGVVTVPVLRDYQKITGQDVCAIFREVTLPDDLFRRVIETLESEG